MLVILITNINIYSSIALAIIILITSNITSTTINYYAYYYK